MDLNELKREIINLKKEISTLQDIIYRIAKEVSDTKQNTEALLGRIKK